MFLCYYTFNIEILAKYTTKISQEGLTSGLCNLNQNNIDNLA